MRLIVKFFLIIYLFFSFNTANLNATTLENNQLTLAIAGELNSFFYSWMGLIFQEALQRMDFKLNIEYYPAKRCTYLSTNGDIDGELVRAYSYGELNQSLIRVEVPFGIIRIAAYAADSSIEVKRWEDFVSMKYFVDYRRGIATAAYSLATVVKKDRLFVVDKTSQGVAKLLSGRSDIFVDIEEAMFQHLATMNVKERSKIKKLCILKTETIHAYLHKKNKNIVPILQNVLNEMKEEGIFESYKETALDIFMQGALKPY